MHLKKFKVCYKSKEWHREVYYFLCDFIHNWHANPYASIDVTIDKWYGWSRQSTPVGETQLETQILDLVGIDRLTQRFREHGWENGFPVTSKPFNLETSAPANSLMSLPSINKE